MVQYDNLLSLSLSIFRVFFFILPIQPLEERFSTFHGPWTPQREAQHLRGPPEGVHAGLTVGAGTTAPLPRWRNRDEIDRRGSGTGTYWNDSEGRRLRLELAHEATAEVLPIRCWISLELA